ncbi:MAG: alpha/beta hydrolase [Woeseiaceae bacterium]
MKHSEGTLTASADSSLYFQSWLPVGTPKAALLVAHGLAEHSGRYQHFAQFFVQRDFAVFALDHPGHGKSDGDRCHIGRFSEFTDGVRLLLDRVRQECPEIPVFLVGHSMGGLIATHVILERQSQFSGCVVSGAALKPVVELSPIQGLIVGFLSRALPRLRMLQIDASEVSRDPDVVDRYRNDPLVFTGKVTARLVQQLFGSMAGLEDKVAAIDLPVLILHGSADGLTHPEGSRMLHERIGSRDKKLIIYEGLYHEIYNEPEREDVMADVAEWLAPRLASAAHT